MTSPSSSPGNSTVSRVSGALVVVAQNIEKYLMYAFYVYLLFIIIAEVIRRYALGFASLWGEETARFSYIFITYLGISWAAHKRTHIRIDMIYGLVSDRTENYLYLFSDLMMILFAAYAFWYSIPLIQTSLEFGAKTQALRVSRAIFQAAVPIGFSLMSIRVLQRAYRDVRDIRAGRPVYKGESVFFDEDEDSSDAAADGGVREVDD